FRATDGSTSSTLVKVDSVANHSLVVQFPVGVKSPATTNPSLKIYRGGSLHDRLVAILSNLNGTSTFSARPMTLQQVIATLSERAGVDPDEFHLQTTGSETTRAVQFTLPFNPDPLTYNQHLDFST